MFTQLYIDIYQTSKVQDPLTKASKVHDSLTIGNNFVGIACYDGWLPWFMEFLRLVKKLEIPLLHFHFRFRCSFLIKLKSHILDFGWNITSVSFIDLDHGDYFHIHWFFLELVGCRIIVNLIKFVQKKRCFNDTISKESCLWSGLCII